MNHQRFTIIYEQLIDDLRLVTDCRDTSDPHWDEDELRAFHSAACRRAANADLTIPSWAQIERCDTHASGHIDWSTKLPLYVAEIMFDRSPLFKATP